MKACQHVSTVASWTTRNRNLQLKAQRQLTAAAVTSHNPKRSAVPAAPQQSVPGLNGPVEQPSIARVLIAVVQYGCLSVYCAFGGPSFAAAFLGLPSPADLTTQQLAHTVLLADVLQLAGVVFIVHNAYSASRVVDVATGPHTSSVAGAQSAAKSLVPNDAGDARAPWQLNKAIERRQWQQYKTLVLRMYKSMNGLAVLQSIASASAALGAVALLSQFKGGTNNIGIPTSLPDLLQGAGVVAQLELAASLVLVGPIYEELMWRGLVLPTLADTIAPPALSRGKGQGMTPAQGTAFSKTASCTAGPTGWIAIAASSGLFAAAHLSVTDFAPLTCLGVALGGAYALSDRNLLVPTVAHAFYNGSIFIAALRVAQY